MNVSLKPKVKDHTGDISSIVWDKEAMKAEVEGYEDNHLINWKELASRYNVCNKSGQLAKNGGQIVKEWLISQGVDVKRFRTKRQTEVDHIIRRKKRRGAGGEISVPTEISVEQLKQKLSDKIESGEYTIGEMIVPKKVILLDVIKCACMMEKLDQRGPIWRASYWEYMRE